MSAPHESNRLPVLVADAQRGLARVSAGETEAVEGWLAYGAALNEGRSLFPGDREFGQWVEANDLHLMKSFDLRREADAALCNGNLAKAEVDPHERVAAMWAAAHRDQFDEARAAGKARTVRRKSANWRNIELQPSANLPEVCTLVSATGRSS